MYFSHVAVAEITNKQISKYYNSIVSVNARVPSDAITARSLGTEREGNGVIIDDNRILTIGYIITEASEIEIGLADGTKLPAVMVGYDHSSGFGIIKPVFHVELEGLKLGDSDKIQLDEPLLIMPSKQRGIGSVAKMVSRRPFSGWWEYYLDKPIFTFPVNNDWGGTPLLNSKGEVLGIGSLFVQDAASEGTFSPKIESNVAVNNVSFKIASGETYGIVGESGSGKSTIARLISGIYKPDEGSIQFDGLDLLNGKKLKEHKKRNAKFK